MATLPGQANLNCGNAYLILRKALNDPTLFSILLPVLTNEGRTLLLASGIAESEQAEFCQVLTLAAVGAQQRLEISRIQQEQQIHIIKEGTTGFDETMAVAHHMREGLKRTIDQIDRAFNYTMFMYVISFFVGLALIGAAIWFARQGDKYLLTTIVLGGLGTASTLTFFFTKPPERLQSSRASLAQLQIALLAWFNDFYNQNVMLGQVNQLQVSAGKIDEAPLTKISQTIIDHTETIMVMLQKYCKLVENPDDGTIHDKTGKTSKPESKAADPVSIAS
jgi:hypothetical protein